MYSHGLAEIVFIVADVSAAARFYRDVVRLTPIADTDAEENWAWFWAGIPGENQRIALHKGPLLFEDHSPLPEDQRWGKIHYAFLVPRDKLDDAVVHVRSKGVEVHGPVDLDWMNCKSFYFYDLDSNLLEFLSPDPER